MKMPDEFLVKILRYPIIVQQHDHLVSGEGQSIRGCFTHNDDGKDEFSIQSHYTEEEKFGTLLHEVLEFVNFHYDCFPGNDEQSHGKLSLVADMMTDFLLNHFDIELKEQ